MKHTNNLKKLIISPLWYLTALPLMSKGCLDKDPVKTGHHSSQTNANQDKGLAQGAPKTSEKKAPTVVQIGVAKEQEIIQRLEKIQTYVAPIRTDLNILKGLQGTVKETNSIAKLQLLLRRVNSIKADIDQGNNQYDIVYAVSLVVNMVAYLFPTITTIESSVGLVTGVKKDICTMAKQAVETAIGQKLNDAVDTVKSLSWRETEAQPTVNIAKAVVELVQTINRQLSLSTTILTKGLEDIDDVDKVNDSKTRESTLNKVKDAVQEAKDTLLNKLSI